MWRCAHSIVHSATFMPIPEARQGRPRPRLAAARASTAASPTRSGTSRACRSSAGRRSPVAEEPAERDEPAFSLTDALCAAGLLELAGQAVTTPIVFRQPVADYVEQFHSTASLARELMTAGEAAAFGQAVEDLVRPYAVDGVLDLPVAAELAWGRITVTARR